MGFGNGPSRRITAEAAGHRYAAGSSPEGLALRCRLPISGSLLLSESRIFGKSPTHVTRLGRRSKMCGSCDRF